MEFNDVITFRRSVRKFQPDKVPEEILKRILEAARLAPTWANKQGVRYLVVDKTDLIEEVGEGIGQNWTKKVPMLIVVFINPKDSGINMNGIEYYTVDAAICLHQLILSAVNEGLGTCWIGWFDEKKIKKTLQVPETMRIIGITPLGYPRYEPREQNRLDLDEIVYRNKYSLN
ncbi:MAG: nitroreductase family protein [Candidatus Lokiarchaeota archaeon]|nr:nitroreductase family protein [Candidatus Lokiarchaeota archaeon]